MPPHNTNEYPQQNSGAPERASSHVDGRLAQTSDHLSTLIDDQLILPNELNHNEGQLEVQDSVDLKFRHRTISALVQQVGSEKPTRQRISREYLEEPDCYPGRKGTEVLTLEEYNMHSSRLFGRLEKALDDLGGINNLAKLVDTETLVVDKNELDPQADALVELAAVQKLLVELNMPYARKLAWRAVHLDFPHEVACQYAYEGLIGAVNRFNSTRKAPVLFTTYATYRIRAAILRGRAEEKGLNREEGEVLSAMTRFESDYLTENQRPPTVEEIAKHVGKSTTWITVIRQKKRSISLDEMVDASQSHNERTLLDLMGESQPIPAVSDDLVTHGDLSLPELLSSSYLSDDERVLMALQGEIEPERMSPFLEVWADTGMMSYADLYKALQLHLNQGKRRGTAIRELLGLTDNGQYILKKRAFDNIKQAFADIRANEQ